DQLSCDADGNYYFIDRIKDAIRRRGENISSFEVESEVLTHPGVEEVAAIAVPNPASDPGIDDEEVKIVVVLREGAELAHEDLLRYLIERLPRHYVPRYIEFVASLPRTPTFKVRKTELRDQGVTAATWDREDAGFVLKREQLV
ncbi:MAG TPA: ATP-dependent acyl-CoA ligase, partial [Solirubrobacteraceae bacterium]